jgi:hypothetical protein
MKDFKSRPEVLIYNPTKSAMQSGVKKTKDWFMRFVNYSAEDSDYIFDLMNWKGSSNTLLTVKIPFSSKEEAIRFATEKNFQYKVDESKRFTVKPKSYASNFTS